MIQLNGCEKEEEIGEFMSSTVSNDEHILRCALPFMKMTSGFIQ